MDKVFSYACRPGLASIDGRQILSLHALLDYAHQAYEHLMLQLGFGLPSLIREGRYHLPIGHLETDCYKPIFLHDLLTIQVAAVRIGNRSFTLEYRFVDAAGLPRARARMVHVAIDPATGNSQPLAADLRAALAQYLFQPFESRSIGA